MYKEIEKLYNIKIPVKSISKLSKYFVDRQITSDNKKVLENFQNLIKDKYNNNIKKFLSVKHQMFDKLVEVLKNSEVHKRLDSININSTSIKPKNNVIDFLTKTPNKDDYIFIGFDIKQGNFNAYKYFLNSILQPDEKSKIIQNCKISEKIYTTETFEEFALSILENIDEETKQIILKSKSFRQIVFGNLSPKKNTLILSKITNMIKQEVKTLDISLNILIESQDEIVYAVKKEDYKKIQMLLLEFQRRLNGIIRVDKFEFQLIDGIQSNKLNQAKKYYISKVGNKTNLKSVPKDIYIPMFVKYIKKEEFKEEDLYYENNGKIYKLMLDL